MAMSVFFYASVATMGGENWSQVETLYELINRILLLVICLELIRTLLTHELEAVLELLAFVVARKTMKPDLTVIDILLCSISFVILLAARKYFTRREDSDSEIITNQVPK
jgi:predicted benzoate:H+ symporter BenE